jgi:hypothetical protein
MVLSREDVAAIERSERLASMRHQETSRCYAVPDYLSPGWQRRLRRAASAEVVEMMEVEEEDDAIIGDSSSEGGARASSLSCTRSDEEEDDDDDPSNDSIIKEWRDQVCKWCYAVADYYGEKDRHRPSPALLLDPYVSDASLPHLHHPLLLPECHHTAQISTARS